MKKCKECKSLADWNYSLSKYNEMTKESTEHQDSTNPPLLIASVGSSTSTKELLECTVCWGGGKIEIDDYGNEEDCTWCNGTGLVSRNL
jgi:hypothetical protein